MSVIGKLIKTVLLNAYSVELMDINNGKLGLSLSLFEIGRYLNDDTIENIAFDLLQEVLALRRQGKSIKPKEIGFVLLYLIENKLIDADFDDLFGEEAERILTGIRLFKPYTENQLDVIPFFVLLWKSKKTDVVCQLIIEILDATALSLEKQLNQMQAMRFIPHIQKWINVFEMYLQALSLFTGYTNSSALIEHYIALFQRERIPNRFITGFYMEKLLSKDSKYYPLIKTMQKFGIQNAYTETMTLAQRINLLYLLKQTKPLYEIPIQKLEKGLFDCEVPMYEKRISQMIPPNKLTVGYETGLARLLLYWVYLENLRNQQDCTRFQYIFM